MAPKKKKLLFRWRDALFSEAGPPSSTRRFVLLALSTYGDENGNNIHPKTETLATATGLSRRRVEGHLRQADTEGWIVRTPMGPDKGQAWRHMVYRLQIPEGADGASPPSPAKVRTERPDLGPEGADVEDKRLGRSRQKVGTERPITSPETSPNTSPSPPEGAHAPVSHSEEKMTTKDLVGAWIARQPQRPPEASIRKQGAVAARLVRDCSRSDLERAIEGIGCLYPHSEGEPWDLFDLERKLAKALAAKPRRDEVPGALERPNLLFAQHTEIKVSEPPDDWEPPDELLDSSVLFRLLDGHGRRLAHRFIDGDDWIAIANPSDLDLISREKLKILQYHAATSREEAA